MFSKESCWVMMDVCSRTATGTANRSGNKTLWGCCSGWNSQTRKQRTERQKDDEKRKEETEKLGRQPNPLPDSLKHCCNIKHHNKPPSLSYKGLLHVKCWADCFAVWGMLCITHGQTETSDTLAHVKHKENAKEKCDFMNSYNIRKRVGLNISTTRPPGKCVSEAINQLNLSSQIY